MVEPTDGTEVESGELRWPPDEPGSPDGQMGRPAAEAGAAGEGGPPCTSGPGPRLVSRVGYFSRALPGEEQLDAGEDKDASGAEMQDN